jgi:dTDP-4-amino-4,6-dideoxygalactose transaminase
MYQLLLPSLERRTAFIAALKAQGISSVFHYVPLHSASAGRQHGRAVGDMRHTLELSDRLVRLPLWVGLEEDQDQVIQHILAAAE